MKPKWKRVGTHGQPPAGALLTVEYPGTDRPVVHFKDGGPYGSEWQWLTREEVTALLPAPDDIEPAPLSEPWQPMETCPEGVPVWIAYEIGSVRCLSSSYRDGDEQNGRIAWAPVAPAPEHPGGAS